MREWKETEIGQIPINWEVGTINNIAEVVTDGAHSSPKLFLGGRYMASVKDMTYNSFDFSECKTISELDFENLKRQGCSPKRGDILISKDGEKCLDLIFVYNQEEEIVLLSSIAIVRLKENYNVHFYRYYLLSYVAQTIMYKWFRSGSAIPRVVLRDFKKVPVPIIGRKEQDNIASILLNLDKKISLLRQQNQDLEELAQTLFKRWFVEFEFPNENGEPYRSSRGIMTESELGEIPEGWQIMSLSSIATYLNGLACQKYPVEEEDKKLPVLKIKELGSGISDNSDWATSEVDNKYIIRNGDVIFSWSGTLMLKIWDGEDCVLNQHLFKVTSDEFPKWLIYQWTGFHLRHFIAVAQSKATTMGHIKRSHLDEAMCIIPSIEVLNKFNPSFNAQLELYINNNKEIQTLTQLRDTLLPKLMSGEIRVNPN